MHVCTKCKENKSTEEMSLDKTRRGGISSWCKECRKLSARKWGQKNPDRVLERNRIRKETYRTNPLDYQKVRENALKTRYGITLKDYNSKLEEQENGCAICGRKASEMTYHLHTDHCHTTNKVRGLLCAPCNTYLGYTKDNSEVYKAAIKYIERYKNED